jgi:predicted metalloprotease
LEFPNKSLKVLAVKDKLTRFDQKKIVGYTIEIIFLFVNPKILKEEGVIQRLENVGLKRTGNSERPFKIEVDAEDIVKAVINPLTLKITIKHFKGPLSFEGSSVCGVSYVSSARVRNEWKIFMGFQL